MQFVNNIKTQNRRDKKVNLTNFNEMVRKTNANGQLEIAGQDVAMIRANGSGRQIVYRAPERVFKKLFDLYDTRSTKLKVRGHGDNQLIYVAGIGVEVKAGTATLDTDITISNNTYIYVNGKRSSSPSATLEIETSATAGNPSNGDDDEERYQLWYIPWNTTAGTINYADIIDYRGQYRWLAGA